MLAPVKRQLDVLSLPQAAKEELRRERTLKFADDAGPQACVTAIKGWLYRAQDLSATQDGGVARHFSLLDGWSASYPETTGYIVPTLLQISRNDQDNEASARGKRMLDWLISIQTANGAFYGGMVDAPRKVEVTFNTGQILMGLAAGASLFGDPYLAPMSRAAVWLRDSLDPDGAWRKHATPFAAPGDKTYETHVSWGLFEADRVLPDQGYGAAGEKNCDWALTKQNSNGWFRDCCLTNPQAPLTHTIGYALRGIVEAYHWSKAPRFLQAAERTAQGLMKAVEADGRLAGRLNSDWQPAGNFVCMTGSVQIAHSFLLLYRFTQRPDYLRVGKLLNRYVRCRIALNGSQDVIGGVKGSFPVSGEYGHFQYLNWAAKFAIDSFLEELAIENK